MAPEVAIDDLLVRRADHRGVQQMLDKQRIRIRRRRRRNDLDWHDVHPLAVIQIRFLWLRFAHRALTPIKNRHGNVKDASAGFRTGSLVRAETTRRPGRSVGTAPMSRAAAPAGPR